MRSAGQVCCSISHSLSLSICGLPFVFSVNFNNLIEVFNSSTTLLLFFLATSKESVGQHYKHENMLVLIKTSFFLNYHSLMIFK